MQILAKSISKIKMENYNQHKNIILDVNESWKKWTVELSFSLISLFICYE